MDPTPLALYLSAAGVVHFSIHLVVSHYRILLTLDAFGMALVTPVGPAKALDMGTGTLVAVGMRVIPAAVGSILGTSLATNPLSCSAVISARRPLFSGRSSMVWPMQQACPR